LKTIITAAALALLVGGPAMAQTSPNTGSSASMEAGTQASRNAAEASQRAAQQAVEEARKADKNAAEAARPTTPTPGPKDAK
jgi:hypothetical protein